MKLVLQALGLGGRNEALDIASVPSTHQVGNPLHERGFLREYERPGIISVRILGVKYLRGLHAVEAIRRISYRQMASPGRCCGRWGGSQLGLCGAHTSGADLATWRGGQECRAKPRCAGFTGVRQWGESSELPLPISGVPYHAHSARGSPRILGVLSLHRPPKRPAIATMQQLLSRQ